MLPPPMRAVQGRRKQQAGPRWAVRVRQGRRQAPAAHQSEAQRSARAVPLLARAVLLPARARAALLRVESEEERLAAQEWAAAARAPGRVAAELWTARRFRCAMISRVPRQELRRAPGKSPWAVATRSRWFPCRCTVA